MVRRGRVDRGRAVGLSWAARGGKLMPPGGDDDAVEAVERPESTAEGVYVQHRDVGAGSSVLLPTEEVFDAEARDADVDKVGTGDAEVKGPDIDD